MKIIVFDAGPLINLSMNGLLYILPDLKKASGVKFIITQEVFREIYERPVTIKKFSLGAIRLNELVKAKVLQFPESVGLNLNEIEKETQNLLDTANHSLSMRNHWIHLVSKGEMSSFAASIVASRKKLDTMVALDERTARMMFENPENLEKLMEKKLHTQLTLSSDAIKRFPQIKCIRSSELVYVAYKLGLTKLKDEKALEAMLYATKFKGAAISFEEINVLKKL